MRVPTSVTNPALTPKQKALRVNLDENFYGSFSEIGAGQETSRYFFQAGASSQSVAKSFSAYSMEFSDAVYGREPDGRYVTENRLNKMLSHEIKLLEERLVGSSHEDSCYFSFANTVSTINYDKTKKGHGWLGISFQNTKKGKYNTIIMHVRFYENESTLQQVTLGKLGVNLIYGAFYLNQDIDRMFDSYYNYISTENIEIDCINFSGPLFDHLDNRVMNMRLVKKGMTQAIIFNPNHKSMMPADLLYKKNIFAFRGSFRPINKLSLSILEEGLECFKKNQDVNPDNLEVLFEITLNNFKETTGEIDEQDFLDRVDIIGKMGYNVLISNFQRYYKLVDYFAHYTKLDIGLPVGVELLKAIFDEKYYKDLDGGILESFGKLFARNVNVYLYPERDHQTGEIITTNNIEIDDHLKDLFNYFKNNNRIIDIENIKDIHVDIDFNSLANDIHTNSNNWRKNVPSEVIELIEKRHLFGYELNS